LTGYGYDAGGNMTSNGSANYTYDAENRLKTSGGVTYTYDGDGNRVMKSSGTIYWGAALAESDLTASSTSWKEYVFFGGKRVARRDASNSSVHYFFANHLGSTSVVTNNTGATLEEDLDYYPYGGLASSGTPSDHYMFNGKERDTESGLDEFGARYYASSQGRFMIPDWAVKPTSVPYANFGNPQSLNLYSYVQNNPTTLGDPDGHCPPQDSSTTTCSQVKVQVEKKEEPKTVTNTPVKRGQLASGVRGRLGLTITDNGKPASGVKVTESNKVSLSENGKKVPTILVEGKYTTGSDGKVDDLVGILAPTNGTTKENAAIAKDLTTNTYVEKDKQTLTLQMPDGRTCTCTDTRTLTNAGPNGTQTPQYGLTVTQPTQPTEQESH